MSRACHMNSARWMTVVFALCAIASIVSLGSISHAKSGSSCIDESMDLIQRQIKSARLSAERVARLRPAQQYEGMDQSALQRTTPEQREERYISSVTQAIRSSLKGLDASGDASQAAENLYGDPDLRNGVKILQRPLVSSSPNARASTRRACSYSSQCEDMALQVRQLYVKEGVSPLGVVNRLSSYKLATTDDNRVKFCGTRSGSCSTSRNFSEGARPAPMRIGEPYVVDEESVTPFPFSNIRSRSIYQVTEVRVCGKPSYLLTSFLTDQAGSFDHSSLIALVTEVKGKTVVAGQFQGYVTGDHGSVPGIFLGYPERAKAKLAGVYNAQAELIGFDDRVNDSGRVPSQRPSLPLAQGDNRGSTGRAYGNGMVR